MAEFPHCTHKHSHRGEILCCWCGMYFPMRPSIQREAITTGHGRFHPDAFYATADVPDEDCQARKTAAKAAVNLA